MRRLSHGDTCDVGDEDGGVRHPAVGVLRCHLMLQTTPPALQVGSLRAHGPRTVTLKDGTVVLARAGDGTPIPFKAETRTGISDHLPLVAQLEL